MTITLINHIGKTVYPQSTKFTLLSHPTQKSTQNTSQTWMVNRTFWNYYKKAQANTGHGGTTVIFFFLFWLESSKDGKQNWNVINAMTSNLNASVFKRKENSQQRGKTVTVTEGEKILDSYSSEKGLISRLSKELKTTKCKQAIKHCVQMTWTDTS